ncbi:hypothetical protein IGI37_002513 [Enterococcus sp. AZ194]|uniref:hypothetical protein n=1 Tax=Enterococcus sp. AZ194 TaxID=2774629 RepID=UPI003F282BE6
MEKIYQLIQHVKQEKTYHPYLIPTAMILIAAGIFILPQLIRQSMIMGSDSIFHFNRFYDAAMQMKNGNFQYFISMYGFQESGRIVNALYGPLMAYVQGALVLISPSWFVYQLLSNYLLYSIAGLSMFAFLRKARISINYSLLLSLFYMTTYSIQYWVIRQGFTSWGAALLPLCLLPIIDFYEKKEIYPLKLGLFVALMFQTHILSSAFLVIIYLPFFVYAFIKTEQKKELLYKLLLSIGLFFLLTLNVSYAFIQVYGKNVLVAPFVYEHMANATIFRNSVYWLLTPKTFILLILFFLWGIISRRQVTTLQKITLIIATFFFSLSTIAPFWEFVQEKKFPFVELIQFPFRFFVPFTVLFLLSLGLLLQKHYRFGMKMKIISSLIILISMAQVLILSSVTLNQWQAKNSYINTGKHTDLFSTDATKIKSSFFDKDLSKALYYAQKSTPDYLPLMNKSPENKYDAYTKHVVKNNAGFTKSVEGDNLVIKWTASAAGDVTVPVIKYADTNLKLNGREITKSPLKLTTIGNPIVTQEKGENQLVLSYPHKKSSQIVLILTGLCWAVSIALILIPKRKNSR